MVETELMEAGKNWVHEHHPQGISHRVPHTADGKSKIKKGALHV